MGISSEFAIYGATLVNRQWAVSALSGTELVVSLWSHRMKTQADGAWVYEDFLGRWSGHGSKLLGEHLELAVAERRPVRLVIARTDDVRLIESGGDASRARKTFKARPERIGRIIAFDGDAFTIVFDRPATTTPDCP